MAQGVTVWFTGLSGSGKTTIAKRVEAELKGRGVSVERLDGDVLRQSLTRDLGFSKEDREKNLERATFVAKLLTRNETVVLSAFIAPYKSARDKIRAEIGNYLEVYVKASMDTLIARDLKGLYKKALAGEIKDFTGVDDPYDEPQNPELVLDTDQLSVEECTQKVLALLASRGHIPPVGDLETFEVRPAAGDRSGVEIPGPIAPHGGVLVNRLLEGAARESALERAKGLRKVELEPRELSDLEMIAIGALSPLTGFMRKLDYECVVDRMRLSDGLVWALPVTLAVDKAEADAIALDSEIALTDASGRIVGVMQVTEKFGYDKKHEAKKVFGTDEEAHPGVARLYRQGEVYLGGPVWALELPNAESFSEYRLTPLQTRRFFDEKGWKSVVAFQTRNPVHRAHEYLQKCALEMVDGLLLHPLVGETKSDDVPAAVRMQAYTTILDHYYPKDRVKLAVFPAAMRYAGPREAVWHALARKNYGCTHFIVGRDHAGVGNYYGTYEAQQMFDKFSAEEIGITPLRFEHAYFCKACGNMASAKTCPHDSSNHVHLSGTKVRELLRSGQLPPPEFSRPEVARVLLAAMTSQDEVAAEQ